MKKIKVLSLFDGISGGRIAFDRLEIPVTYYASEVDETSIAISKKNYPDIIQLGDVTKLTDDILDSLGNIDVLIGGSPCQGFSLIGYMKGMTTKDNIEVTTLEQYLELKEKGYVFEGQSYLFWEYVRILKYIKPKYFFLENVKMQKKWKDIITKNMGVEPIEIDSALVSAQHRERNYWTNIKLSNPVKNKNIKLDDILDIQNNPKDVSHCKTVQLAIDGLIKKYGYLPEKFNAYNRSEITDKSPTLSLGSMVTSSCATTLFVKDDNGEHIAKEGIISFCGGLYPTKLSDGKYVLRALIPSEAERLQTLPIGYTDGFSDSKRFKVIGNGWTIDIIAEFFKGLKD